MKTLQRKYSNINMTDGNAAALVLKFALPLMAGNLFQQLYSLTDAAIIGRYVGIQAFGAINAVSWIIWFLNAMSRDCSTAFSISASIRIGQKNIPEFKNTVHLAVIVGSAVSVLVVSLIAGFQRPLMRLIHVPEASFEISYQYLIITVLTLPVGILFHQTAALLRAAGDSNTTFTAMTVSTIVNILLDLLFVLVLDWGVRGAALATSVAQLCAALIALREAGRNPLFSLEKNDRIIDTNQLRELAGNWLPLALNSCVITLGGIYVLSCYNRIGTSFNAGISASTKIFNLFEALIMAITSGASVFVGQNLGAGKPGRIRQGMKKIVLIALLLCAAVVALCWCFDSEIVDIFLSKGDETAYKDAHRYGLRSLHFQITGMFIMVPMYIYRVSIQSLGKGKYALVAGVMQLAVRIATMTLLVRIIGETAYYLPTVLAWAVSLPIVYFPFRQRLRHLEGIHEKGA